ncbi:MULTISPECIES: substrate-binding domain-containing protein [Maribacter]|uniref:Substrate-binding domain-containing protein n=1 Tax=Maribacter flavus TaxID=1658664 RepID=A0ABU7II39_9FLAO|nr:MULTISPECIES: substrate-binding domain-containing protein [Maribacter]MDC6405608.1 substrate-binding domain-containing protein [Maribacter sp. PR66]MEE1972624.1 substrate-binding domain-containing protein [Maribacter flavus]
MKTVKIVGVPEHFNLPWHLALEEGAFEDRGIDLQWEDIPEGTGRMCQLLSENKTDLAIILTEGIVKSISEGNQVKIVQEYIASPLLWGVHVSAQSDFEHLSDLRGAKAAISRFGSGSHLMAFVQAQNEGWDLNALQFEVINDLEGAIKSLSEGTADYFMWEHFTTKPIVDDGVFRRLGDCPTPWPCFMLVATNGFLQENKILITHILEVINLYTSEFKNIPSIDRTLANRYGQKLEDIQTWLSLTSWSQQQLDSGVLENVLDTLQQLKLIEKALPLRHYLEDI